ncbi:DUF4296 domain-containing protein [Daejeonella sp.]|jgi:hypothetical protein|uniref:DUF4296 domain-containing protein n=1 Tax=Daejeonella sp. TaxID=2805397 RepID=UPI003784E0D0
MKVFHLLILCLLFFTACTDNNSPKDLIEEQKMINIMSELHIIDGYMSSLTYTDSIRINGKNFYNTVYKNNGITKSQYENSLKHYSMDPVKLDSMYSDVQKILTAKEKKLNKNSLKKNPELIQ